MKKQMHVLLGFAVVGLTVFAIGAINRYIVRRDAAIEEMRLAALRAPGSVAGSGPAVQQPLATIELPALKPGIYALGVDVITTDDFCEIHADPKVTLTVSTELEEAAFDVYVGGRHYKHVPPQPQKASAPEFKLGTGDVVFQYRLTPGQKDAQGHEIKQMKLAYAKHVGELPKDWSDSAYRAKIVQKDKS